jgi:hypothetical protein
MFSLRRLFRLVSQPWPRRERPKKRPRSVTFRPMFDVLEDRIVLGRDAFFWTGLSPVDHNWSNKANWDAGHPDAPRNGDTLVFTSHPGGSSTAVVDVPYSVELIIENDWGGTIQVNNPLTTTGSSQWVSGTMNVASGVSWSNTGTLTLDGANFLFLSGTLNNNGTIIQTTPGSSFNELLLGLNAVLNNTGLYDIRENGTVMTANGSSGQAFNNAATGILRKSGPATAGTATLGTVPFNNAATGTVDVTSGTLSLSGGGTDQGGTFTFQNNGVLNLSGVTSTTLTGAYTGTGAGTVSLAGGTLTIGSSGATFNFPPDIFQWTNGTINAIAGALTNAATGFLTLNGASNLFLSGTLNNDGTITQTTPGSSFNELFLGLNAVLNNTGLYDIRENGTVMTANGSSGQAFNNTGTFRKSAGTGTSTVNVPFTNQDTPATPDSDVVTVLTGTLSFTNTYTQTAGDTNLNGGSLSASGSNGLNILGGFLDGSGDVFANVTNGGTVSPGGDGVIGVLTIHGNYTQTANGTLNIDIQDPAVGASDQLQITGNANVLGKLNVNPLGAVNPGTRFLFMTYTTRTPGNDFTMVTAGFTTDVGLTGEFLVVS